MDGFSVSAASLTAAAAAAGGVSAGVRAARPAAPVEVLADALPGGVTAAGCPELAHRLAAGADAVAAGMARNAEALTGTAIAYRAVDEVVAAALGAVGLSGALRPG